MKTDFNAIVADFVQVAALAGVTVAPSDIALQTLRAPHTPGPLPAGKQAVYVFLWREQCLKVGKVGPRSSPRYQSQHYSPNSSKSNLARSILSKRKELGLTDLGEDVVGAWIRENTDGVNLLLDVGMGIRVLSLLESFLQCRLNPVFEGFDAQR